MKTIQIACVPANWDESTITAVGMTRNGRAALPKSTVAKALPEPWLTVWHGIVTELSKLDPGGWAATFIHVVETADGPAPSLHLTINRRWDDNTTAAAVELDIEDEHAVALFDWLTRDEQPALAE